MVAVPLGVWKGSGHSGVEVRVTLEARKGRLVSMVSRENRIWQLMKGRK